ncbi:MAG: ribosome silencing factor [Myxococcales bacterium]|nr:ribosome silencing factor [Myxococcales bacterium]
MELAHWAEDKKAENIFVYEVKDLCSYADYVVICSGNSDRHVSAIAETLREEGKHAGHMPLGVEGLHKAQWVLLDFGDVVVHVFYGPVRDYYDLDRLWPAKSKLWSGGEQVSSYDNEDDDL